jgi:adenosylmethionine-8-amino-7-oxononanoate aminotransferase
MAPEGLLPEELREKAEAAWLHFSPMDDVRSGQVKCMVRAEGNYYYDINGKELIDGLAGLFVVAIGHGRKELRDAAYAQMEQLEYFSMFCSGTNLPVINLGQKLKTVTPEGIDHFFFVASGSEAVETCLKLARQYFYNKGEKNRNKFISRIGEYHGVTLGALSINGVTSMRTPFEPLLPGYRFVPNAYCYRCDYNQSYPGCDMQCARQVETTIKFLGPETVAAVVGEPATSGGGIFVPPKEYWPMVREICDRYGVLIIDDEVINGFGRTGNWFGCQTYGYKPDLMSTAKGIISGYLPLACAMTTSEIYDAFLGGPEKEFQTGNTFGGHPVASAVALKNVEILERENLPQKAAEVGAYLLDGLKAELGDNPIVGDIRGVGLLQGIEYVRDKKTKERDERDVPALIAEACYQNGLYCRGLFGVLQLAPCLTLTKPEADRVVDIIARSTAQVQKTL